MRLYAKIELISGGFGMAITKKAYAKVNLGLDVVGTLPNGYHLLRTVMQQINLYDEITAEKIPEGIVLESNLSEIPLDETNLAYKGAKAVLDAYGIKGGIRLKIEKRIPAAAGMAGGSADCAAAMQLTSELYHCQASVEELCSLGVKLGADVPFCIAGGTRLCEGIGEKMTEVPLKAPIHYVIIKPPEGVSTKYVFEHLSLLDSDHPDTDGIVTDLQQGEIENMAKKLKNVLATVTEQEKPLLLELREKLKELGALGTLMSGSGPTVFGIFATKTIAKEAAEEMKRCYPNMFSGAFDTVNCEE